MLSMVEWKLTPRGLILAALWACTAVSPARLVAQDEAATAAVVRGRCVAAESGAPLAGCTVSFSGADLRQNELNAYERYAWKNPSLVVTGDDGRFEFRFASPPRFVYRLEIQGADRVPGTARWDALRPGEREDLGDVHLRRGVIVEGRMLDQDQTPVGNVWISVDDLPLSIRDEDTTRESRGAMTDARGRFRIQAPLPLGTWPLEVNQEGISLRQPLEITVTEDGLRNLTVRVQRRQSISGAVFDDRGRPVPGVTLSTVSGDATRATRARTRKDGSFAIFRRDGSPDQVQLVIEDPGPCEPKPLVRNHSWNTHGLRLELRRALSFELTVVEADTGTPVEQYAVQCYHLDGRYSTFFTGLRLGRTDHPNGIVTVDKVWRGVNQLRVAPQDRDLMVSRLHRFDAQDGIGPMRVEVQRMKQMRFRITDASGAPRAGETVHIVVTTREGQRRARHGLWTDLRTSTLAGPLDEHFPECVSTGTADAKGYVALRVPPAVEKGYRRLLIVERDGTRPLQVLTPAALQGGQDGVVEVAL